MKNLFSKLRGIWLLGILVLMVCALTACDRVSSVFSEEGYVEVTGLRIDQARVSLSPTGEASSYQLDVEILPKNATNRQLKYYIPSEYLSYLTVSSDGLLSAHKKTEEGMTIPVTVTSTTNASAKLTVTVTVEEVAVKSIRFNMQSMSLLYEGEPGVASLEFNPSHATDGRTSIEYTSLNEAVATVSKDASGNAVVTPVGVGQTRIKAVSTTIDLEKSEAFMLVTVDYVPAQYRLVVSGSPQWKQVINNFSAINFTLYVLGDHCDPDPKIEWYVGTERVLGQSNMRQYAHVPTATTQISYRIGVSVRAYKQDAEWLYSDEITVYKSFSGFDLKYNNLSSVFDPYQYGDTATFEVTESTSGDTASYDWFLQKTDGDGNEVFVANTPASDRNLTRRINVTGDYMLLAKAKTASDAYLGTQRFPFSTERLTVGDVLSVDPVVFEGGLPPDSYHWYYVLCDENGDYDINEKQEIKSTAWNVTFFYPLKTSGMFRLIVASSTNGVLTTMTQDGEKVDYYHIGIPIRVYESNELLTAEEDDLVDFSVAATYAFRPTIRQRVTNISIEGTLYQGENLLYVHWTPTAGVDRYEAEISFTDGSVVLLDSAAKQAVFGVDYLCIPSDIASFDDAFGIRIKQKDGVYSERIYYNIFGEQGAPDSTHFAQITADKYKYFAGIANENGTGNDINDHINAYVTTTDELYALVEYVLLYLPTQNSAVRRGNVTVNGVLHDTFSVTFYSTIEYSGEIMNAFDVDDPPDDLPSDCYNMYVLLCGMQQQSPYRVDYSLALEKKEDGAFTATFTVPHDQNKNLSTASGTIKKQETHSAFSSDQPYNSIGISYPIDKKQGVRVYTSDQLVFVMEQGYRPVPTGSDDLSELYKKIKSVYSSLVDASMSDTQKALAFYDWLVYSVSIDGGADELARTETAVRNYRFDGHHLEGIFAEKNENLRHALADGYAKAFSALCGLAGIPCRTVAADISVGHTFNKVYLEDDWYVVDVFFGSVIRDDGTFYADHGCFMISDARHRIYCTEIGYGLVVYGVHPSAEKMYDFYGESTVSGHSIVVSSEEEWSALLNAVTREGRVALEVECEPIFCDTFSLVRDRVIQTFFSTDKYVGEVIDITEGGGNIRVILFLYDN